MNLKGITDVEYDFHNLYCQCILSTLCSPQCTLGCLYIPIIFQKFLYFYLCMITVFCFGKQYLPQFFFYSDNARGSLGDIA